MSFKIKTREDLDDAYNDGLLSRAEYERQMQKFRREIRQPKRKQRNKWDESFDEDN